MAQRYIIANGPMPTTAALSVVQTGTAIKTMLQIAASAGNPIKIDEWGIFFNATAVGTPVRCELIETGSVAATVTAHQASGVMRYDFIGDGGASSVNLGTSATGFTATAEGTPTATRLGDMAMVPPTSGYVKQFPLGKEFLVPPSTFARIRVTAAADVGCWCYCIITD